MELTLQILTGLATLMLSGLGIMSMFAPRHMLGNFALEPVGIAGLSTIRSVIGGLFLACVAILVLALLTGEALGLIAVVILMAAIVLGRVVSLVLDGFDKAAIPPLIAELVIIAILLAAHSQMIL